jgi:Family of unknown function (DUF6510)
MSSEQFLDGNAAAGPLHEVFAIDLTAASGECAGCGRTGRLAEARVYNQSPGLVLRCPGCESVLMRVVSAPGRTWLDMRGLRVLQVSTA